MRKFFFQSAALTVLLLIFIGGCSKPKETPKSGFFEHVFSATMLVTTEKTKESKETKNPKEPKEPRESKYYKDEDKLRFEDKNSGKVYITRKDNNLVWELRPAEKTYMEQTYSEAKVRVSEIYLSGQRTKIGEEIIDGHPCVKYELTPSNQPDVKTTEWQAKDLRNFPIRMEGHTKDNKGKTIRTLVEYKDISFDKPAAELFEVPKDYKKVAVKSEDRNNKGNRMPAAPQNTENKKK